MAKSDLLTEGMLSCERCQEAESVVLPFCIVSMTRVCACTLQIDGNADQPVRKVATSRSIHEEGVAIRRRCYVVTASVDSAFGMLHMDALVVNLPPNPDPSHILLPT
jgi:hypothetical protein